MRNWLALLALFVVATAAASPASAQPRQGGRVLTGLIDYQNDSRDGGLSTTTLTLDLSFGYMFGAAFEGGGLFDMTTTSTSTGKNRGGSSTAQLLGAYGKYHFNPSRATPVYAGGMFASVSGDASGSLLGPILGVKHFATSSLMLILESRLLLGTIANTNLTRFWVLAGLGYYF